MFDIAFSEIVVIAVVALIVIGPERLPKVARTLGHMFGRLQRYVNDVKADINREMELDELRKLKSEVQAAASEFERGGGTAIRDCPGGAVRHRRDGRVARRVSRRGRGNAETNRAAGVRPDLILGFAPGGVPPPAALQWPARVCAWFASR